VTDQALVQTTRWRNWSGLETAVPTRAEAPVDTAAVVAAVQRAREEGSTVKMVGTGHSFTAISAPEGTMLRPTHLAGIVSVDRDAMTVTALAGTLLKDLNRQLEALGLSLHNMGDIAEQTLAGATSTGTHGTGGVVASLSAQVCGLSLVTGTGEVVTATETANPEILEHARLGLGALGVLTTLTFRVEPLFVLEADETPMSWDEALGGFDERVAAHHHVDTYWFPHTDRMLTKTNDRLDVDVADAAPLSRLRYWWDDELLSNTVFGALNQVTNRAPRIIPRVNRVSSRLLSARTYSDAAHRVFVSPRGVVFREMEYAVPREAGLAALRECRAAIERSGVRVTFPVEIRVTPADDIPLSTSSGRESLYLAFHTHRDADHRAYFALLEPILRAHDGRPHWGKVHTRIAADLAPAYPRFGDFLALRDRLDPDRVFANAYLRRVLGD
jgi:FAD-linked oxidoreductase